MKNDGTVREKLRVWMVCLTLAIGSALLYAPVLRFDYITLDDPLYLDDHITRGFSWPALRWCLTTFSGYLWHPLTWVSHMLDCQFFGAWMGGHHATNVVLHIFTSVLLFLLLRRMTGALWRSVVVAALFAWHPMHVESVAWIAERKDVLSALFWMLTMWAYIRYVEQSKVQPPANGKKAFFYILALVFFTLGLMAKPMLVTLPFALLLLDWWPLARIQFKSAAAGKNKMPAPPPSPLALVLEKIPFVILSIVFSVLTMVATNHLAASLADLPLSRRLETAVMNYFLYVAKLIWPENMVILYPFNFQRTSAQITGACLFVAVISLLAFRLRKSRPYFLLGWLWYLGILVPVIGLVQVGIQPMADRYTYIPSIGLFIIVCWGAYDLLGARRHGAWALGALGWAALVACVLVTSRQLQFWRDSDAMFTHTLDLDPENYNARSNYAAYFYDRKDMARAVAEAQRSLQTRPDYALSHSVLGNALVMEGKGQEAIPHLTFALRVDPASLDARLAYAKALLVENQPDETVQQINRVLAGHPENPEAYYVLGRALLQQGDLPGAVAQLTKAMSFVQSYPDAQLQLAVVQARQGRFQEALGNYRGAKNVPPGAADSLVMNNLAWTLATSPYSENRDGAEAVQLALRARNLDHSQHAVFFGTLAAAYAEAGQFDEAVAAAQQAHDLALAQGAKQLAARNLELLEIYRSHKVFHETLDFQH